MIICEFQSSAEPLMGLIQVALIKNFEFEKSVIMIISWRKEPVGYPSSSFSISAVLAREKEIHGEDIEILMWWFGDDALIIMIIMMVMDDDGGEGDGVFHSF